MVKKNIGKGKDCNEDYDPNDDEVLSEASVFIFLIF